MGSASAAKLSTERTTSKTPLQLASGERRSACGHAERSRAQKQKRRKLERFFSWSATAKPAPRLWYGSFSRNVSATVDVAVALMEEREHVTLVGDTMVEYVVDSILATRKFDVSHDVRIVRCKHLHADERGESRHTDFQPAHTPAFWTGLPREEVAEVRIRRCITILTAKFL